MTASPGRKPRLTLEQYMVLQEAERPLLATEYLCKQHPEMAIVAQLPTGTFSSKR